MKKIKFVMLFIAIIFLTGCGGNSHMDNISLKEYKSLIENKETFILEIMRTDCSACQAFKPKLEEFLNEYKVDIKVINTDNLTEAEVEELNEITSITGTPTIIFYTEGKETSVATRIIGNVSKQKIIDKMTDNKIIK